MTNDAEVLLQQATLAHTSGNLAEAEKIYRQILAAHPDNTHALFLLGVLLLQSGGFVEAVPLFRKVIELEPDNTDAHMHLALAARESGDTVLAEKCYLLILNLSPSHLPALFNLAELYQSLNRFDEALARYQDVLRLQPDVSDALFNQAIIHFHRKNFAESESFYRRFLALRPDSVEGHYNLGAVLQDQARYAEAKEMYIHALRLNPGLFDAYRGIGNICLLYDRDYLRAVENFLRAFQLKPGDVEILCNLGVALQKLNRLSESENVFRQALLLDPQHVNAHFNLALVLLLQGKFQEGWLEYKWRLRIKNRFMDDLGKPEWSGETSPGKALLVRAEQGFGDTIQFCRYLKLLQGRVGSVVFECQTGMQRLMRGVAGIDEVCQRTASGRIPAEFDLHVPLLDLPGLLATDMANIPQDVPYVVPEKWQVERWKGRLSADHCLRVGFVWAGRPTHEDDLNRSVQLADFIRLAEIPNVSLYSLQKGIATTALDALPVDHTVTNLEAELDDFADTAAAIANLDLVISIDTSVAHLAGALNKPVWVLLPFAPDWRWLSEREDTPWYPSMRLFRQNRSGNWGEVFARVESNLRQLVASESGRSALKSDPDYVVELMPLIQSAWRCLRAGEFDRLVSLCLELLGKRPQHVEASLLAGLAHQNLGEYDAALPLLERVRLVWPAHPALLKSLGMVYQSLSKLGEAADCYTQALRVGNEAPDLLYNLGTIYLSQKNFPLAKQCFDRSLAYNPAFVEALNNLGLVLRSQGQPDEAIACFGKALQNKPDFFDAQLNLGNMLASTGRLEEAEQIFRSAISLQPNHAPVRNSLAVVLKNRGRLEEAVSELHHAVQIAPDFAEAHNNLGNCLKAQGNLTAAVEQFRRTLHVSSANAAAWNNLGNTLQALGETHEALSCFDRALGLLPDFAEAHWNRGIALLLSGDYADGWKEYEWGFAAGQRTCRQFSQPKWQGGGLAGKTLLVYAEQGFGDTIQFVRFLKQAKQAGGRIVLECQPELVRLMQTCSWLDEVVPAEADGQVKVHFDCYISLMSLPAVLGIILTDLPGEVPYLSAHSDRMEYWQEHLTGNGRKIGLVWAGNPAHQNDANRSCSLMQLAGLLDMPAVSWFSLQKFISADEQSEFPRVCDLGRDLTDFAETAAVIANLDLVITVDTAVAHLAGALGKAVWVMVPYAPDWRWLIEREDSPWYPTARLFRQEEIGNWGASIQKIKEALVRIVLK